MIEKNSRKWGEPLNLNRLEQSDQTALRGVGG
jgi:hypothetical protein